MDKILTYWNSFSLETKFSAINTLLMAMVVTVTILFTNFFLLFAGYYVCNRAFNELDIYKAALLDEVINKQ